MDPRIRLGLVACAGILAISLERPPGLALLCVLAGLPLLGAPAARAFWGRGLLGIGLLVWGTALSQGLFYAAQPRVAWVELGPLVLWREGVQWGLAQSLRFVALSLAGLSLALRTPPDRVFAALVRCRVPFGLALMGATAMRALPVLGGELIAVRRARADRGRPTWARPPWAWIRLELDLLRPVVARAWRRAQVLAESLDARGFDPLAPRTSLRPLRLGALDLAVGLAAFGGTGAVAAARVLYLLYTSDTLYLPALRPLYSLVRTWG